MISNIDTTYSCPFNQNENWHRDYTVASKNYNASVPSQVHNMPPVEDTIASRSYY